MAGRNLTAALAALALLVNAVPCFAQDPPAVPPPIALDSAPVANDQQLLDKYVWTRLGLEGALLATLSSGLDQWRASPPEWGGGASGYAKRWASEYSEAAIGDTATYAIAHVLHHDPSFTRCECSGFANRLHHAAVSPFIARTRSGRRVLSVASLAGFLVGDVVAASTWYPARRGARDGLLNAAGSLGAKIGIDVLLEFAPRLPKIRPK